MLTTRISFLAVHCSKKICSIVSNRALLDVLTVMLIVKSGYKALDESHASVIKNFIRRSIFQAIIRESTRLNYLDSKLRQYFNRGKRKRNVQQYYRREEEKGMETALSKQASVDVRRRGGTATD